MDLIQSIPYEIFRMITLKDPQVYYPLACVFGADARLRNEAYAKFTFYINIHKQLFEQTLVAIRDIQYTINKGVSKRISGYHQVVYGYIRRGKMNQLQLIIKPGNMIIEPDNWRVYDRNKQLNIRGRRRKIEDSDKKYSRNGGVCKITIHTNCFGRYYEIYDDNLNQLRVYGDMISEWQHI